MSTSLPVSSVICLQNCLFGKSRMFQAPCSQVRPRTLYPGTKEHPARHADTVSPDTFHLWSTNTLVYLVGSRTYLLKYSVVNEHCNGPSPSQISLIYISKDDKSRKVFSISKKSADFVIGKQHNTGDTRRMSLKQNYSSQPQRGEGS